MRPVTAQGLISIFQVEFRIIPERKAYAVFAGIEGQVEFIIRVGIEVDFPVKIEEVKLGGYVIRGLAQRCQQGLQRGTAKGQHPGAFFVGTFHIYPRSKHSRRKRAGVVITVSVFIIDG